MRRRAFGRAHHRLGANELAGIGFCRARSQRSRAGRRHGEQGGREMRSESRQVTYSSPNSQRLFLLGLTENLEHLIDPSGESRIRPV